jgi:hypothetical protein
VNEQRNYKIDFDKYLNMTESLQQNISKRFHWTVEGEDKERKGVRLKS